MTTTQNDKQQAIEVAQEIMRQIGLNTRMSIGLREVFAIGRENDCVGGIQGKVGRRHRLVVKLNGLDLYDITVGHVYKYEFKVDAVREGVYFDQLPELLIQLASEVWG